MKEKYFLIFSYNTNITVRERWFFFIIFMRLCNIFKNFMKYEMFIHTYIYIKLQLCFAVLILYAKINLAVYYKIVVK